MPNTHIEKPSRILSPCLQDKISKIFSYMRYAIIGAFLGISIKAIEVIFFEAQGGNDSGYLFIILCAFVGCVAGKLLSDKYESGIK